MKYFFDNIIKIKNYILNHIWHYYYDFFVMKQKINHRIVKIFGTYYFYYNKNNDINVNMLWDKWCQNNRLNSGDYSRFMSFILNCNNVLGKTISGDIAELGVYKGNSAFILNYFAKKYNRKLILFDTFNGFNTKDIKGLDSNWDNKMFSDTSLNYVKKFVGDGEYRVGYFPDTIIEDDKTRKYAFVSLDCDLGAPMKSGLEFFYQRLVKNGVIMCHDYSSGQWLACTKVINDFCEANDIGLILLPDVYGTAVIIKN